MIDENAFGILISYFSIEEDEYAGEREEFVDKYVAFAALVRDKLSTVPPGESVRALDLGYAIYVEVADGDQAVDPIGWLRELRQTLREHDYQTAGILSHGGRWLDDGDPRPDIVECGSVRLVRAALPSEPLRRALLAEAATHPDEDSAREGWGAGLYLDVEAVEALGRRPKNAPTVLSAGGAAFFRAGS